jgi:hypothetical protein
MRPRRLVGVSVRPLNFTVRRHLMALRDTASDLVKALAWLGAGLLWEWVALHYVSDTPTGAVVLLLPFFLAFAPSVYFFGRARGLFRKGDDDSAS